jgi:2-C-methyl-D-erythritol 4-phosphate cytidylyltransferase / 2-C-methyl-D-erythritol 2,4-cyclodiphosphate synthase
MTDGGSFGAILVAAGRSERMGFDKLWEDLGGQPVIAWSIEAIARSGPDRLVVVAASDTVQRVERLVDERGIGATVVSGGVRRRDSVSNGLHELRDTEWVVVHDAARPLASAGLVQRGLEAARRSGAAVPVLPLADTVKRVDQARVVETVERESLRAVQTPQIFRRALLAWAMRASDDDVTDEAGLFESLGGIVYTFPGQPDNLKLTYPDDLVLMRELVRRRGIEAE